MTRTLIHHTDDADFDATDLNPRRDRFDLCLTDTHDAQGYGEHSHEVEVDCSMSHPSEVVEIADERGLNGEGPNYIGPDSPYFYLLIDDPEVQEALVEEGITAVQYQDEDWDNEPHTCYRILDADAINC